MHLGMRCSRLGNACWRHAAPSLRHQQASLRRQFKSLSVHNTLNSDTKTANDVFKDGKAFSLERAIDTQHERDSQLWESKAFQFSVYPDLPRFMRWSDLLTPRYLSALPYNWNTPACRPNCAVNLNRGPRTNLYEAHA